MSRSYLYYLIEAGSVIVAGYPIQARGMCWYTGISTSVQDQQWGPFINPVSIYTSCANGDIALNIILAYQYTDK